MPGSLRSAAVVAAASLMLSGGAAAQLLPTVEPLGDPVGCATCGDARAFGAVMGVSVLPEGGLAVADRDEPVVRVFGPDGSLQQAFGRHGQGPGELRRIGGVAATARGTLVVSDFMGRALTEFGADGTLVELHPVESTAMAIRADPTGRWLAWQIADWASFTGSVHLRAADGSADSTPLPSTAGTLVDAEGRVPAAGLFAAAPGPDGRVAVAQPMVYRIEVLGRDGRALHTIVRDIERTRRTAPELDALESALRRGPGAGGDHPEAGAPPPDVDPLRPHFLAHGLAYDGHGRLWVRTARGGPEATLFDVFDAGGTLLGEVQLPVFLESPSIGYGVLAGVVTDATTGVQRLHRWRIVG